MISHTRATARTARFRHHTCVWLLALAPWCGCRRHGEGPPKHYEDPTAMIVAFDDPSRDRWQMPDRVVRSLPVASTTAVIADIGAGSGYFTRRLALQVPKGKVYAVDVDDEFFQHIVQNREAWGTPNIEPRLAFYDDPALPDGELDLIFIANTLPFLPDRVEYLRRIRKALKQGGVLAIIDFHKTADPGSKVAPQPQHRISKELALQELELAGFVLEREETFLPYQWFLIMRPKS